MSKRHQDERLNLLIGLPDNPTGRTERMLRIEEGVGQAQTDCAVWSCQPAVGRLKWQAAHCWLAKPMNAIVPMPEDVRMMPPALCHFRERSNKNQGRK